MAKMVHEFESDAWCAERNAKLLDWVRDKDAVNFILDFGEICEVWDDLIDKDKPLSDERIHNTFWILLTQIPINPFFERNKLMLIPLLISGINAWLDANDLEKGDLNDQVFSYVLRDWYMEFVSFIIYLTRGREKMRELSLEIRSFFTHNETLDEYREKLP